MTLRAELQKVAQLRHAQKIKEADTLFASVDDTPSDASTASRAESLAKQRVRELRDCCFSMGGLSLTRRILERFLNTPEVRLLLPEAVRKQREEAVDSETSKILLKTAKIFLTKLFKAHASEKAKVRRGELEAFQMLVTLKLSEMSVTTSTTTPASATDVPPNVPPSAAHATAAAARQPTARVRQRRWAPLGRGQECCCSGSCSIVAR